MAGYRLINGKMVWDPNYDENSGASLDTSSLQKLRQKYAADMGAQSSAAPSASASSNGGSGISISGLAGGAATGAVAGAPFGPWGAAAGAVIGAGASALGEGMAAEEAEKEKKRQEAIALRQQQFNNKMDLRRASQTDRSMNQSGLEYLSNTRNNAIGQFRNLLYRS